MTNALDVRNALQAVKMSLTYDIIATVGTSDQSCWLAKACKILLQVCQYEHQLFDHFFPGEDPEGPSLAPLMDPLATILYDALRPRFIHLHSLEELCEIVDILTHEASCLSSVQ